MTRCGFKWKAPRIPTPGDRIRPGGYELIPGGVIHNPTSVEQECVLRVGHGGDHRSMYGVTAAALQEETP